MGAHAIAPTPLACRFIDRFEESWQPGGGPKPGDMFYVTFAGDGRCRTHEPPCARHLYVVTPDGHWWDIDGRASNCTLKEDKAHRCWVRHGDPPHLTVDKNGLTCAAGAGSIQTDRWYGFLRDGHLVT